MAQGLTAGDPIGRRILGGHDIGAGAKMGDAGLGHYVLLFCVRVGRRRFGADVAVRIRAPSGGFTVGCKVGSEGSGSVEVVTWEGVRTAASGIETEAKGEHDGEKQLANFPPSLYPPAAVMSVTSHFSSVGPSEHAASLRIRLYNSTCVLYIGPACAQNMRH